jgi:hypothetical protein
MAHAGQVSILHSLKGHPKVKTAQRLLKTWRFTRFSQHAWTISYALPANDGIETSTAVFTAIGFDCSPRNIYGLFGLINRVDR